MCELTCSGMDVWCQDNHVESVHCHACHAYEANRKRDSYTVSADRRTDLGTAVYAYICEYSICSTVKYERIFISDCICERGLGNGDDRDSCELSWAQVHGARVWKMIQRLAANLPYFTLIYLAYIHQTRNLQSHTLDWRLLTVHRTKNHTTPCRKALPPTLGPLWSLPHSDLYVCSIS